MKLSDYVSEFIAGNGIEHVFGLTGGAVVHLFDSVNRAPGIEPVFCHHEQAGAFAAEAYARVRDGLGAAFVTTGPGGTNALTGVCAAWLDSIPCLYISGQARLDHTTHRKPVRQLATQQLDIVPLVRPITKYAVMIEEADSIRYHLEKAAYIAQTGRPGPVWLDIPLDLQWALIDPESLPPFDPNELGDGGSWLPEGQELVELGHLLAASRRPVVLAGYGLRLAHAEEEFRQFIEKTQFPFLSTWNATAVVSNDHPLYLGRPGTFGQRGANLAIQNCDLLLSIGSHLCIAITGTLFEAFAREAKVVMVDVDQTELEYRTVQVDLPIHADAKVFLRGAISLLDRLTMPGIGEWHATCSRYVRHNAIPKEWREEKTSVNPYVFVDRLSDWLKAEDILVVDGGGTVNQITFQSFRAKQGQRVVISGGVCSMGSGLPESVGASLGSGKRRTICLCGDGSMQLNIQELQTIAHHGLPIKIFVLSNGGYLSIRNTQDGFLEGRHVGSSSIGGLSLPDITRVAHAYGVPAVCARNHGEMEAMAKQTLATPGPALCELIMSERQEITPRQGYDVGTDGTGRARPLEDMFPFLDRSEFAELMCVRPWGASD